MRAFAAAAAILFCLGLASTAPAAGLAADTQARNAASLPAPQAASGPLAPSTIYTGSPSLPQGAATVQPPGSGESANALDDYDFEPVNSIADPIEPWNRFWFRFNDIFYLYVAQPAYDGWKYITPSFFRTAISNLFNNLLFPTRFVNNLLQFRFRAAGVEFSRFLMNVMGSAGLVDISRNKKTIVPVDPDGEDFGQTLASWGVGQGFYIVWPFIGPSSLRDSIGRVGDLFTDPIYYVQPWTLAWGTGLGLRFNDLGSVLPTYNDLKSIAVDPYLAMREAYVNMRAQQVRR